MSTFFVIPWIFGAPFEPSSKNARDKIVEFANPSEGDVIAELGSGSGNIVIALAKKGATIHGYEINPFLVLISRARIKKRKLKNAKIFWKNFWKVDLSKYNKIVLFQFRTIMKKLERKILAEMKSNSKIISHYWKFPTLNLVRQSERIFLYNIRS